MALSEGALSLCDCSNPVVVKDTFHGLEQSYCENCGNVVGADDMRVATGGKVEVKDDRQASTLHMRKFLSLLDNFCGVRGLSSDMREQVSLRGEEVWRICRCKRDKERYAVACIADVLQRKGIEFDFRDLCNTYRIEYCKLYSAYKQINGQIKPREETGVLGDIYDVALKCDNFIMSKHDQPSKLTEITDLASTMYKLLEPELSYTSYRFAYLASALCILATKHFMPKGLTNQDVANMMSVNVARLSTMVARLSRMLLSLAERMPWKPAHVSAQNIYLILDDIVEYSSPVANRNDDGNSDEDSDTNVKERKIKNAVTRIKNKNSDEKSCSEDKGKTTRGLLRRVEKRFQKSHRRRKDPLKPCRRYNTSLLNDMKEGSGSFDKSSTSKRLVDKTEKISLLRESPITKFQKMKGNVGIAEKSENMSADDYCDNERAAVSTSKLDSEDMLIEDLLLKGCDAGELMTKNYNDLCKTYYKDNETTEENLSDDEDISDSDIASYCLTPEEILVKARICKNYYL